MPGQPKTDTTRFALSRHVFLKEWLLISTFWLLIALASVLEARLFREADLADAVRSASMQWLPWVLLSPVILWLSSAYTLERSTWLKNMWIHLAACILIVGGLGTLAYYQGPQGFGRGGPGPFGRRGGDTIIFQRGAPPPFEPRDGEPQRGDGERRGPDGERRPPDGDHRGPDGDRRGGPGGRRGGPPPGAGFVFFRQPGFMVVRLSMFQLPTFLAVLGVCHALRFSQRAKERERRGVELESRLVEARLQALRMQLNPHFLFNTLNSIASLVYEQPRVADEMIGSLSELLRLALNASDRQQITLREELHFLDQYLFIEQTRFGDRLRIEKDIEPAALDAVVPILILQPLAENAVKHGIEAQLTAGIIRIEVKRLDDILQFRVSDNGRGVPEGAALKEGVGLSNTRARIRELYGDRGTVRHEVLASGGFLVEIQIPWETAATPQPRPS